MSLSSSAASSRRPGPTLPLEETEPTEVRRTSKYDIYGSATKPFGESYRRSLVVQDSGHEPEDEDRVETMGCSTSRTQVSGDSPTKGTFSADSRAPPTTDVKVTGEDDQKVLNNNEYNKGAGEKLSDFEIIYGVDLKNNNKDESGDVYAEVKKPEKKSKEENQNQTTREKLMQQIRERREPENGIENKMHISPVAKERTSIPHNIKKTRDTPRSNETHQNADEVDRSNSNVADPVSFIEEEYSYEPGNNETTSKLVVRSRSLANLEDVHCNATVESAKRLNAMKITTKPDGTIRYGVKQGSSNSNLLDDSDDSPIQESEIKNNYVSSIKNAFDAAIESQARDKTGKAEAFDGLRQYFHDNKLGLQELLVNNNVVIIEPFRHEPPKNHNEKADTSSQRTCRITGATVKSPVNDQTKMTAPFNTLPRRNVKCQQNVRQGFYHPIKNNKEIVDTELPDPEKVKSAREWFEQIFKSKSSSEIPAKKSPTSFYNTISGKSRITAEVKVVQDGKHVCNEKRKQGRYTIEQAMRDDSKRYPNHRRWTDTGSLSSGVSSDFSCDQDCEFHYNDYSGGSTQEVLEEYSTEEEDGEYFYPYEDNEIHPVSTEVLQKIRACGTTVTYYGGKVISRSHGQIRSPMTMTIMDEIRQGGGTTEGRKKFETEKEEPYLGVKFRLVKSNSCGSRLEIAGTEGDDGSQKLLSPRHESFRGKSITEEVTELREEHDEKKEEEDNHTSLEEEEDKAEADRYLRNIEVDTIKSPQTMTWAELKLKEARKQWHCAPEAVRVPSQDMEFETFEVLDETKARKAECTEAGRG